MTLHQLVSLREQLHVEYKIDSVVLEIQQLQNKLKHLQQTEKYNDYVNNQIQFYENVISSIVDQAFDLKNIINSINTDIAVKRQELFSGQYELELTSEMVNHDARLNRNHTINEDADSVLIERLRGYTDFHYPAVEIGCRTGEWTNRLVAADPLYIVDLDQRFLDRTMDQFNEVYRRRIRPYVIDLLSDDKPNLNKLPQGQFGFIFSWEFFNYLPLSTVDYYLTQFFNLARAGGVVLLRFNNGDTSLGAKYAETRWQSYISGEELVTRCQEIGFEILKLENINLGETSWIEIKKPGKLQTAKVNQSMGAIKD